MKKPVPLDTLDPVEVWTAWKPDDRNAWSLKWAGHLYRRAAFGGNHGELGQAVKEGPNAAIDRLLAGRDGAEDELADYSTQKPDESADTNTLQAAQALWLARMLQGAHPLRERMTLFWHNHFATSVAKVRTPFLMERQNRLIRRHALGKFRPLLLEMSQDPAMLKWLDSNSNVKGHANENYAREFMELFSLGVGNYTEKDVQEAARAFTGWHTDGENFIYNQRQHAPGKKTVLGQTGNWDGADMVRIVLEQPATARFLVRKLFRYFISESQNPPDRLVEPLAEQLRKTDYDIGKLVQTLLRSRLFFSEHAYRQRIKGPVEYLVGLIHSLEGQVAPNTLPPLMEGMGQALYAPPTVKGWDGGKVWLNSATVLARHNLAWSVVGGENPQFRDKVNPPGLLKQHKEDARPLEFLVELFFQGDIAAAARQKLLDFLQAGNPKAADRDKRIRETAHHLLLLPEYQLA